MKTQAKPQPQFELALSFGNQSLRKGVPHKATLHAVLFTALCAGAKQKRLRLPTTFALALRIVDEAEGLALNHQYRHKTYATNVLSFPADSLAIKQGWLGDIVVCKAVIEREALAQHKPLAHHYLHMCVHAALHLLGFEHEVEAQANQMEQLEAKVLARFEISDPYLTR